MRSRRPSRSTRPARRVKRAAAPVDGSPSAAGDEAIYARVVTILDQARSYVSRTINTAMVQAYWLIGREIVQVEQQGENRAMYGTQLLALLADRLTTRFGTGFSEPNLRKIRQFYTLFPNGSSFQPSTAEIRLTPSIEFSSASFPPNLAWSHYVVLLRVRTDAARAFYEIEAASGAWSVRELERQIASLLFERLARSRNKEQILALAKRGHEVAKAADALHDPVVLEFLDHHDQPRWHERDLEAAILDRIDLFLRALGKGFLFEDRQKRISLDGDYFYVDLVLYNRLLSCYVLVDLKLGKLTHQDLGQIQMYVNWYDRYQRAPHESPTIGIVLCSDKNDAMVRITLPDSQQIFAAQHLPSEEELRAALKREREEAERELASRPLLSVTAATESAVEGAAAPPAPTQPTVEEIEAELAQREPAVSGRSRDDAGRPTPSLSTAADPSDPLPPGPSVNASSRIPNRHATVSPSRPPTRRPRPTHK